MIPKINEDKETFQKQNETFVEFIRQVNGWWRAIGWQQQ